MPRLLYEMSGDQIDQEWSQDRYIGIPRGRFTDEQLLQACHLEAWTNDWWEEGPDWVEVIISDAWDKEIARYKGGGF
jgi:hypothetical protein